LPLAKFNTEFNTFACVIQVLGYILTMWIGLTE